MKFSWRAKKKNARREFLKNFMGRKNIGKPKENQWFSKIATGNDFFSIFFCDFWEIMTMKIMYEQKTKENQRKTNDFKKSLSRESEKV